MKRTKPLKRISDKKLAKLGGKMPYSTITAKPKPITRATGKRERNRKLKAAGSSRLDAPQTQQEALERVSRYAVWVRGLPCLLEGLACMGRIEVAHVQSRGAGGADEGNTVPLCSAHHRQQHDIGLRSFNHKHRTNLERVARRLFEVYERSILGRTI